MSEDKRTVRIKMKVPIAGPKYLCKAGNEINVEPEDAKRFKSGGFCEYVNKKDDPDKKPKKSPAKEKSIKVERAVVEIPENATTQ